jgi:hypothetical protein
MEWKGKEIITDLEMNKSKGGNVQLGWQVHWRMSTWQN